VSKRDYKKGKGPITFEEFQQQDCGDPDWPHAPQFKRVITQRRTSLVWVECEMCGTYTHNLSHRLLQQLGYDSIDDITAVRDNRCSECLGKGCLDCQPYMCSYAGCTSRCDLHWHHTAPKYLFGIEEANRFPTVLLCPEHHQRYHELLDVHLPRSGRRVA
jgi:hypothetical protein